MTHLAIDLALAGVTGVCWGTGPHDHDTLQCPSKLRGGERMSWIRRRLREYLVDDKRPRVTTVLVERPIIYSKNGVNGMIGTLKLHGAIEHMVFTAGLPYVEVDNQILKQFATGRANASKDDMLAAARDLGYDVDDHNAADAIHLYRFWVQREQGAA